MPVTLLKFKQNTKLKLPVVSVHEQNSSGVFIFLSGLSLVHFVYEHFIKNKSGFKLFLTCEGISLLCFEECKAFWSDTKISVKINIFWKYLPEENWDIEMCNGKYNMSKKQHYLAPN